MLTRQNFNGIKLTTIHEYIDLLNSRVNANIDKTNNWQSSVSHLRTYLNSHNINTVSKESINNYIDDRLNVNIHVNELFDTLEDDELFDNIKQFREEYNAKVHKDKTDRLEQFKDFLEKKYIKQKQFTEAIKQSYRELEEYRKQKDYYGYDSYREWKKDHENQAELVDDIMDYLYDEKYDWTIDFEQLFNNGKHLLLPRLKEFLKYLMDNTPIINKYKVSWKVNGEWHSKPLTPEVMNKLYNDLTEENFIFEIDETPPEYHYKKGKNELPPWCLFSAIRFNRYHKYTGETKNSRVGSFFNHILVKPVCDELRQYLIKLQIFDSLVQPNKNSLADVFRTEILQVARSDNDKIKQRKELNDCCFVYALKQTGLYDETTLNAIRLRIQHRFLSSSAINSLCEEFKIHIKVNCIDEEAKGKNKRRPMIITVNGKQRDYVGIKDAEPNRTHTFNLYNKHYFLEETTPFSTYYINHLSTLTEADFDKYDKEFQNNRWKPARTFIKSSNLVKELMKQGYFEPITYGQFCILNTIYYKDIDDVNIINLEYNEDYCTQLIAPHKKNITKINHSYWYADFECDVSGDIHKPFMCVIHSQDGTIKQEFRGENCNKQLLEFVPDGAIIYFHNLAYDIRMVASFGINRSITKGNKFFKANINYYGKTITFKDSLPMISCKLSQFPKMFDIPQAELESTKSPNIKKELFPYKYYTLSRLATNKGLIANAGNDEDKKWTNEDYETFNHNIDSIPGCRIDDNGASSPTGRHFDMWKYASFYCQQDVKILRLGFNQFRQGCIKDFKLDPFEFISISSLANEYFNRNVYYPNGNLYKLGGHIRKFCAQAIYGGRCMTAYNKKWHTTKPLYDFDAVSLYPSAMHRLYTVEGIPEVLKPEQLNMTFLNNQSEYIVDIRITKVNKHYAFPLITQKDPITGLNINDDNLKPGETITLIANKIYLEDLIEFQQIEFELVRGLYWGGKRDYRIQQEISKIFNKRLEYKKQHNPLQENYKLIMNSCYGKTIERPVEKDYKYIQEGDELTKFWTKNYYKIDDDIKIENSNIHAIRTFKPIDKHFNFSLFGIQVLSMSKRIMNEVMCLAFDIGCHIYYQDTDSMHIEVDDLPKLIEAYKNKYNRDLVGNQLGQFHSDFPTINEHDEIPKAVESYFLMKKMYIDKLQDSTGDVDYMSRGKGLTQNSIKYASKQFDDDYMKLYEHLYNGNECAFDLTQGQPCFEMNKNMTISTKKHFIRKICTKYEEGNREEYFNYAQALSEGLHPATKSY